MVDGFFSGTYNRRMEQFTIEKVNKCTHSAHENAHENQPDFCSKDLNSFSI